MIMPSAAGVTVTVPKLPVDEVPALPKMMLLMPAVVAWPECSQVEVGGWLLAKSAVLEEGKAVPKDWIELIVTLGFRYFLLQFLLCCRGILLPVGRLDALVSESA